MSELYNIVRFSNFRDFLNDKRSFFIKEITSIEALVDFIYFFEDIFFELRAYVLNINISIFSLVDPEIRKTLEDYSNKSKKEQVVKLIDEEYGASRFLIPCLQKLSNEEAIEILFGSSYSKKLILYKDNKLSNEFSFTEELQKEATLQVKTISDIYANIHKKLKEFKSEHQSPDTIYIKNGLKKYFTNKCVKRYIEKINKIFCDFDNSQFKLIENKVFLALLKNMKDNLLEMESLDIIKGRHYYYSKVPMHIDNKVKNLFLLLTLLSMLGS